MVPSLVRSSVGIEVVEFLQRRVQMDSLRRGSSPPPSPANANQFNLLLDPRCAVRLDELLYTLSTGET